MTEPVSVKNEPFTDFPRQAYSFITDDFCHDKAFVAKATAKTAKSVIKLKEAVSYKKESWSVADEIKLWFDLPNNRSLYAKIKSNDYIKLNYDHGLKEWKQNKYNLFAGFNSTKGLRNIALKAGVGHYSQHCDSENRIRFDLQQNVWQWGNRTVVKHNKLTFGIVTVLDITNRVLQKNNLLLGYNVDPSTNVFLRAETGGFRKVNFNIERPETIFDTLTLDVVRKINDNNKAAVEVIFFLFRLSSISEASNSPTLFLLIKATTELRNLLKLP